nr:hypothetical protein [Candidatus Eremiobacteraeota bacterium]
MIFPPAAIPIAILLNGTPLQSYNRPYVLGGQVLAPVAPYVTRIADRIAYSGGVMIVSRGRARIAIRSTQTDPAGLQAVYVPIAGVLRGLGARVTFDRMHRVLDIEIHSRAEVQTMSPQGSAPAVAPTMVFTPEPVPTPRPV